MSNETINILCNHCKTNMKIESKYLVIKNSICCINCEQIFPENTLSKLKTAISLLEDVKNELKYKNEIGQTHIHFRVTINNQ